MNSFHFWGQRRYAALVLAVFVATAVRAAAPELPPLNDPPIRANATSGCRLRISATGSGDCRICSEMRDTIGMATTLYRAAYTWIWLLGVTTCSTCKSSVRRNVGRAAQLSGP
jgi:hypothetical protein